MYKISVPMAINSIRDNSMEEDLCRYEEYFRQGNVERVFVAVLPAAYTTEFFSDISSDKLKITIEFFKDKGYETGVWIGAFGHGSSLSYDTADNMRGNYQKITGVTGEAFEHGYCPLDKNFESDYMESIDVIAKLSPDMIMIDDDFRLNFRQYRLGCFCDRHLEKFCDILGRKVTLKEIDENIFKGGRNEYRDAYMQMSKDTLLGFAEKIRETVDKVNPNIRVGFCSLPTTYDLEGTDQIGIAKALAGKTKPFLRTFGAPYHNQYNVINAIESERIQFSWLKSEREKLGEDVEFFAEGDTYPRPRYNVSAKSQELFDLAVLCDNNCDGILKYMFDYDHIIGYETGYIENHIKTREIREKAAEIFKNKKMSGLSIFTEHHKIQNWNIEDPQNDDLYSAISMRVETADMFAKNSIPVSHGETSYPVAVSGENARYIPIDRLKNGAVLDIISAKILTERGVDTGLISARKKKKFSAEYYVEQGAALNLEPTWRMYDVECNKDANVISYFMPDKTPASYTYENSVGVRFLVFASDFCFTDGALNYFNNYYRQEQLFSNMEWVGGKKLPVILKKNPNLFVMAADGENSLSVLLINFSMDDIYSPVAELSDEYNNIKFVYGDGKLNGDKVYLSDIPSYGYVIFEVTR